MTSFFHSSVSPVGVRDAIESGGVWLCASGAHINAGGGGFYYEDGTYYWVGEKRIGSASHGFHLYRSDDLYNWTHEGVVLAPLAEAGHPMEAGCVMERPKLVRSPETGKYLIWFHLELKGQGYGAALVGVAESDSITGPYQYVRSFRPNGHDSRDMTVFQAEDGKAFLVYASEVNLVLRAAELTADCLGVTERDEPILSRHREAPAIFAHAGRLYMVTSGCTGWAPNASEIHVADTIWGPWTFLGNPALGDEAGTTFGSQPTSVLPVQGREDAFVYVGNRWRPKELHRSEHVWLPIELPTDEGSFPVFRWRDRWDLSIFPERGSIDV